MNKKVILTVILVLIGYILNEYDHKIVDKYYDWAYVPAQVSNGESFEQLVRNGTYKTIEEETWNVKPFSNSPSFMSILINTNRLKTSPRMKSSGLHAPISLHPSRENVGSRVRYIE